MDIDHEVGGEFFEGGAERGERKIGREQNGGAGLEEHVAIHRGADAFGGELLDVDAVGAENFGYFEQNARTILADQCKCREGAGGREAASVFGVDQCAEAVGLKSAESGDEFVGAGGLNLDANDAGELSAETAHAALEPVAAVAGDAGGDEFDKAWAIGADDRHDEIGKHGENVGAARGPGNLGAVENATVAQSDEMVN